MSQATLEDSIRILHFKFHDFPCHFKCDIILRGIFLYQETISRNQDPMAYPFFSISAFFMVYLFGLQAIPKSWEMFHRLFSKSRKSFEIQSNTILSQICEPLYPKQSSSRSRSNGFNKQIQKPKQTLKFTGLLFSKNMSYGI